MSRKLVATRREDQKWDFPDHEIYDEVITTALAYFIEANINHSKALLWSSVGQAMGIGLFAMAPEKLDLIEQFRLIIRKYEHSELEFETFPKEALLESYGLSLYAHKGTKPFRPTTLVEIL